MIVTEVNNTIEKIGFALSIEIKTDLSVKNENWHYLKLKNLWVFGPPVLILSCFSVSVKPIFLGIN